MAISKDSPKRRKSIAVANHNQNKPAILPRGKRRPHSIVPGDRLSPFAKARRSLAPRKSILKTFTNILHNDNDTPDSQSQTNSSSQPAYLASSLEDTTDQTMDFTNDYRAKIHDNTTRKSFGGRRVSFAENVHVRLIENLKKDKESISNESPESHLFEPTQQSSRPPNNENDYPGAPSGSRHRSLARFSLGGEDMDLTSIGPQAFFSANNSAIADEEFDFDYEDDGMDMTEVVRGQPIRKRSMSTSQRAPLALLPQKEQENDPLLSSDMEQSHSYEETDSQAMSDDPDQSELMDFTIPLSRSKRPPVEQDAVWHALRQATHSGDTPIEPEPSSDDVDHENVPYEDDGMDLDDAVQRLMRARASLPSVLAIHTPAPTEPNDDDSFSTEGSFEEQPDQTMNLNAAYSQISLGGDNGRQSMGSTMDESEVYGTIAVPLQSNPRQASGPIDVPHQPKQPVFTVFQPPSSVAPAAGPSRQQSAPPIFTPISPSKSKTSSAPLSPAKAKQSPARTGFSAAFAPPVARPSPGKRSRADIGDDSEHDRPSSAKRVSLGGKWATKPTAAPSPKPQPKPLSPSKKAPFQVLPASTPSHRPSSSIRRPSGYFAKRKSLGAALGSELEKDETPAAKISPKETAAGLGFGRVSMGSGSGDAWQRFDKDQVEREKEAAHYDREASQQTATLPTNTRGSPAPASSRPAPPPADVASPQSPVVDVSALVGPDEDEGDQTRNDMSLDATEQWRNEVQDNDFNEANDVRALGLTTKLEVPDSPISIKQFFAMTGIKFMDDLTAPRRSTHPAQQTISQPREREEIPLSEYVSAMGMDIPQLTLYSRVSKDLEAWIEKSKVDFSQAEDEAAKFTPELFTEYSRADEEGQAELLHQLQLIRTNTRALAKSDWYDWKLQWLEGLRVTADHTFQSLEMDAKALEALNALTGDLIPALKQEYEDILKELDKETAEVADIEACDQDYLNELKASIAEQNIEVEALRAEVAESKAKLLSLEGRLKEANAEKQETRAAISDAQGVLHIQTNGTRAEVFKLKAKEQIVRGDNRTTRQIVHRLSDYWSSCAQLRAQLKLLLIKFPVEIEIIKGSPTEPLGYKAKVMIMFPSMKAKAFISFVFGEKAFSYWPVTVNSLEVEVEVAYGAIDRDVIAKAVVDRLSEATPEDNYACLLDACIGAQEIYD
ncbi:hypothetical protein H0H87_006255 [Tephrocybe sp. NHM501043]|nr:hypothetical protein H0H87_006255 [Tephrocybe sp. NHM501043]